MNCVSISQFREMNSQFKEMNSKIDSGSKIDKVELAPGAEFGDHLRDMSGLRSIFLPSLVKELQLSTNTVQFS